MIQCTVTGRYRCVLQELRSPSFSLPPVAPHNIYSTSTAPADEASLTWIHPSTGQQGLHSSATSAYHIKRECHSRLYPSLFHLPVHVNISGFTLNSLTVITLCSFRGDFFSILRMIALVGHKLTRVILVILYSLPNKTNKQTNRQAASPKPSEPA